MQSGWSSTSSVAVESLCRASGSSNAVGAGADPPWPTSSTRSAMCRQRSVHGVQVSSAS